MIRLVFVCALCLADMGRLAQGETTDGGGKNRPHAVTNVFNVAVPAHPFDLILGRPEKNNMTLSVLAYQDLEGIVEYGAKPGVYTMQIPIQAFKKGVPVEEVLGPLESDSVYYYHFRSRMPGTVDFNKSPEYTFHTVSPTGSTFTFTLTADSHLDEHTSPEVYRQTLANIRADRPAIHIDLGNLFMTDKQGDRDEAGKQYVAQRFYLGLIGHSTPVFLALGTHDGESGRYHDASEDCLAVWSNRMRKRYFPNPVPDGFYTGNTTPDARLGLLQDYYAWTWGDALFVVLDPFWFTNRSQGGHDGWDWTLGLEQYRWLKSTLERSSAAFKFVFIHNLLSGDQAARGGVEVASLNEWGGKNKDGGYGFEQHRPGWGLPVHDLLVRNHVAAVFKAHDNFYARQELDGIVYLMVPQPSFAGEDRIRDLEAYGYKQGKFLGNSGHVRVSVSPGCATIRYVRSCLPQNEATGFKNGEVVDCCTIDRQDSDIHRQLTAQMPGL